VVPTAMAMVVWSSRTEVAAQRFARWLPWRRSPCQREHNEGGMSESGKEWRLTIHIWRPRGRQGMRQQARRMVATSLGTCSPLGHFPEYMAGAKVDEVGVGFGPFLG
jgi:hypothetical protein